MNAFLLVALGGALGASARYGAGLWVGRVVGHGFPYGTLLVNIAGSLVMGLLIGFLARNTPGWQNEARLFGAVGVLGGFTTFSAFSLDAVTLIERGDWSGFSVYVLVSVMASLLALFVGLYLMRGGA